MSKNGENVPASKMSFSTPEHFEQNMVRHRSILKWREVPTKVIYHNETVEQITMKLGRVTMVISLVDENGTSLKEFSTSYLQNNLKDFGLGREWFIRLLDKCPSSRNPSQSY